MDHRGSAVVTSNLDCPLAMPDLGLGPFEWSQEVEDAKRLPTRLKRKSEISLDCKSDAWSVATHARYGPSALQER